MKSYTTSLLLYTEGFSKLMSQYLRHNSEVLKELGASRYGAVELNTLHKKIKESKPSVTVLDVVNVVRNDKKGRYVLEATNNSGTRNYFDVEKEVKSENKQLKEPQILNKVQLQYTLTVRAAQGHSTQDYEPLLTVVPPNEVPEKLYHGTGARNVPSILSTGLHQGARHHVHFTPSKELAKKRGEVVLQLDTKEATKSGWTFLISDNGVYFLQKGNEKTVPPKLLKEV